MEADPTTQPAPQPDPEVIYIPSEGRIEEIPAPNSLPLPASYVQALQGMSRF